MSDPATLIDKSQIPDQVDGKSRELIESYLDSNREGGGEDWDWQNTEHKTSAKVTVDLCKLIKEMYSDGASATDIIECTHIRSRNTVYYHVNDECSHTKRSSIAYSECGWMRRHARKGASTPTLSVLHDVSKRCVRVHVTGECDHTHGCETVSIEKLRDNARSNPNTVTSVCPVCGEEFEHREYHNRTTCSKSCNGVYAREKCETTEALSD